MEAGTGFRFAFDNGPIDRRAASILWKQRPMHVQSAARRGGEQTLRQQIAVIEREQEVRPQTLDSLDDFLCVRVGRSADRNPIFPSKLRDAAKPLLLQRIIFVSDDQRDMNTFA